MRRWISDESSIHSGGAYILEAQQENVSMHTGAGDLVHKSKMNYTLARDIDLTPAQTLRRRNLQPNGTAS